MPDKDLQMNIDRWSPSHPLWVGGTSGDGKSTLSNKIAKKYNAQVITSDVILARATWPKKRFEEVEKTGKIDLNNMTFDIKDSPEMEYIRTHPDIPWQMPNGEELEQEVCKFYKWFLKEQKKNPKYKDKKFVIEGCSVCAMPPDMMSKEPLIIVGGSRIRSLIRRSKRNTDEHGVPMIASLFKYINKYNAKTKPLDDRKDRFATKVKESKLKNSQLVYESTDE